jgi:hypothetical protein
MAAYTGQLKEGFWVGIGFATAFAVWALLQMLLRRAEGH